jgi:hypothetical protein
MHDQSKRSYQKPPTEPSTEARVVYPSGSKYGWTRGEVDNLRTELERLHVLVRALQARVERLERQSKRGQQR